MTVAELKEILRQVPDPEETEVTISGLRGAFSSDVAAELYPDRLVLATDLGCECD